MISQPVLLEHIEVDGGIRGVANFERLDVAGDADDLVGPVVFEPLIGLGIWIDRDVFPDWIDAGKVIASSAPAENSDAGPAGITKGEIAPSDERDAEGFEVTRGDKGEGGSAAMLGIFDMAFSFQKTAADATAFERRATTDGGRVHTGNGFKPLQ